MQDTYRNTAKCSERVAIAIAMAIILAAQSIGVAHAAEELPGHVCTFIMGLQNGEAVYVTRESITYATRLEVNGTGKHIIFASNDLSKIAILIKGGKTTPLDSNTDLIAIVEREFGAITNKDKESLRDLTCSDKLFPPAYFDIK